MVRVTLVVDVAVCRMIQALATVVVFCAKQFQPFAAAGRPIVQAEGPPPVNVNLNAAGPLFAVTLAPAPQEDTVGAVALASMLVKFS